jgi:23S rRNA (cytosine1962-C5)-methyltransferase
MADGYALIDAGDGRRLERFGDRIVDRPAPGATEPRRSSEAWDSVNARFERIRGDATGRWRLDGDREPWAIEVESLRLELRYASGGQVGLFPEHLAQAQWIRDRLANQPAASVLHLFAYTGALTLVAAVAGASVAHVDGSRAAVTWARRNAEVSGASACPIRWLVEDAERFVRREAARGRRYTGAIVDPPSYGHGPGGAAWRLEERLDPLLRDLVSLLDGPGRFVLLTSHTPRFGPHVLATRVGEAVGGGPAIESGELAITAESGARLDLGAFARWCG